MPIKIREGTYYTVAEAASELKVSDRSVYTYITDGRLEVIDLQGKVLIAESELKRFKSEWTKWEKR